MRLSRFRFSIIRLSVFLSISWFLFFSRSNLICDRTTSSETWPCSELFTKFKQNIYLLIVSMVRCLDAWLRPPAAPIPPLPVPTSVIKPTKYFFTTSALLSNLTLPSFFKIYWNDFSLSSINYLPRYESYSTISILLPTYCNYYYYCVVDSFDIFCFNFTSLTCISFDFYLIE